MLVGCVCALLAAAAAAAEAIMRRTASTPTAPICWWSASRCRKK